MEDHMRATWREAEVTSPHIARPINVIAAKDVPYLRDSNRLQNLSIYLPKSFQTQPLVGTHSTSLPKSSTDSPWLVYIHGGAWRDPLVLASSIEPTVAQAFGEPSPATPSVIVSLNYCLSPHPSHPTHSYDPAKGDQNDSAREFQHPRHVLDVIFALNFLRHVFGLQSDQYVLAGHSCGATLALQAILVKPDSWSSNESPSQPPRPSAILGLNGLFDLPLLIHKPDTHANLKPVYEEFLKGAFGDRESVWEQVSPASFPLDVLKKRWQEGTIPKTIVLDQSKEDQLVPMNQTEAMESLLTKVEGLKVIRGSRMKGLHNEAWETGTLILESFEDGLNPS